MVMAVLTSVTAVVMATLPPVEGSCIGGTETCQKALWRAKLQIFGLSQYDCLVLLDADMILVRNIDHLFDLCSNITNPVDFIDRYKIS